jgi:predicted Rossmann fold nucleotide-binding protein DprA/Smf involved in DNA uptake
MAPRTHHTCFIVALPLSREHERRETLFEHTESAQPHLSTDEEHLLKILGSDTMHIDALVKRSTLETSNALAALAFLEMKGLVKNIGNIMKEGICVRKARSSV